MRAHPYAMALLTLLLLGGCGQSPMVDDSGAPGDGGALDLLDASPGANNGSAGGGDTPASGPDGGSSGPAGEADEDAGTTSQPVAPRDAGPVVDAQVVIDPGKLAIGGCARQSDGAHCDGTDSSPSFVLLEDGADVTMVRGPQSAWMFVVLVRTSGIYPGVPGNVTDPDNPRLSVSLLLDDSDELLARSNTRAPFAPAGDDLQTESGVFLIVEGADRTAATGALLRIEATVTDRDGVVRTGSQRVTGR